MIMEGTDKKVKKRLLIATDSFLPRWDGIARFLYEVVPFLNRRFDITIVAPKFPGAMTGFENIDIVHFPIFKWRVADTHLAKVRSSQIAKLVQKSDIVWTQSIGTIGGLAMYHANKQRKPLVAFVHSVEWFLFSKSLKHFREFVELSIRKLVPFLYNKCRVVMVPFEGMGPILESQGVTARQEVVYLGVDVNRFRPPESRIIAKQRIGIDPNKLVIGYLGRFGREKDIKTLYEAFRRVHQDRPNTTLLLVGGELDPPFEDMGDVKVIGSVNNTIPYYHAMDIYVLPSLTETTSLTTMEAMASGLPVVVTPVGYLEKYVRHKVNGFIFPPQNVEKLYIILSKLVKDLHLRKDIGAKARETMVQKHTWQKTAEDVANILDNL
jgi:glycosyltransferase involved in cell wall biosynthesis